MLIATPDHWHAAITVMACQAGKDVYCEKPLCRTIEEGRKMVEAARRYERVVQMGTQYRSIAVTRQACEWVRNGRLGKVHTVRLSHPSQPHAPERAADASRRRTWIGTCGWGRRPGPPTIRRGAISASATSWTTAAGPSPTTACTCSASCPGPWARTPPAR